MFRRRTQAEIAKELGISNVPAMIAEKLIQMGYRRTSNKYGGVSRIDRSDWQEVLKEKQYKDVSKRHLEDHYRRVYSKDKLEFGPNLGRLIPNSNHDYVGYIPLESEAENEN